MVGALLYRLLPRYSRHMPKSILETWADKVNGSGVPVPIVRQETNYTCGPAVMVAVLRYFGVPAIEHQLATEAGTTEDGTSFEAIVEVLRSHGMDVTARDDLSIGEIRRLLSVGQAVIIALQAWDDPRPIGGYSGEWNSGHYVVPVAVNNDSILFEDPAIAARRTYLTHDEFLSRWHSIDSDGVYGQGYGLVVTHNVPILHSELKTLPPAVRMG